jgi:hypothetical protein
MADPDYRTCAKAGAARQSSALDALIAAAAPSG